VNDLIDRTIDYLERQHDTTILHGREDAGDEMSVERLQDTIFLVGPFFMEKFTFLIEQTIVGNGLTGGQVLAGFRDFRQFGHRLARFREIDALGNEGFVYGTGSCEPWQLDNIQPVRVASRDPLGATWFMIYREGEDHHYALVARAEPGAHEGRESARYKGFWSTREPIVRYLADYLYRVVNAQYAPGNNAP